MLKLIRFSILFVLTIYELGLHAKEVKIENVEFNYSMKKIIVNYNIVNNKPTERFQMELLFITEFNDTIVPFSISGDIVNVTGGIGKTIAWDYAQDNAKINNINIKAIVSVKSVSNQPGDPSNAWLSLLVPGLGDRYVTNPRHSIIKPYYITIATYSFIGAGMYNIIVKSYYDYDAKHAVVPDNIQNFKNKSKQSALYAYIYTGIGVIIWGADIIRVLAKGEKKKISKAKISLVPIISPCPNGFLALSAEVLF